MPKLSSVAASLLALGCYAATASDVVWSDDTIPAGAWTGTDGGDSWNWISSNPAPYSGALAHQSAVVAGIHWHYFSGASATLPVNTGDTLFTYVYLDPANPPSEVMLEWSDGTSWGHAAYWGANLIPWGVNGTSSQYPVGALPPAGQWARLEVPANAVGLEGSNLAGMQFILSNGRATWDHSGKGTQTTPADTTPPVVSMTAPANGATVSGASVTVSANATDNVGVANVQFKLDGANLGAALTAPPYALIWDPTSVANGSHSLSAVASDAAGNQATATAISLTVNNSSGATNIAAGALPTWVGAATHNWKPRLGGVYWLDSRAVVKQAAPYLTQNARPVLVDIKSDATGFGYRFDLNSWDSQSAIHSYYPWDGTDTGTPASPEDALNILGATGNAEFMINIPIPLNLTATRSSNWGYDGYGYTWQTPQFYAAMVQYLVGAAGPQSEWQNLPTTLDFFSQPASFNWADLRARRGHVNPYSVVAFIIGSEPYNIEGEPNGALYGPQAEKFRVAIRSRGVTTPLGLHVHDMGYVDDPTTQWFWPTMGNVTASDFSFIDLEHYYQFSTVPEDFKRAFPVSINPNAAYWMSQSSWKSDYRKFLWIVQDTRNAIRDDNTVAGLGDPSRWSLGFSEHGIQISSQFVYNDMFSAMHWAGWLAESMRQNIAWDSGWTLLAEGFSHAQLQVRDGYVTRTPMFFVYQMAQEFYGLDYLTNSYASPMGSTIDNFGNAVQYPWTTVRALRDPASGNIHLFVINQSTNSVATVAGFESWNVLSWKQLAGASYSANNPLGVPGPEPIQTVTVALPAPGSQLAIPPISVNHIILSGSTNSGGTPDTTSPTVVITAPTNNASVSGSGVSVAAFASDNVGVAGVQFKLDGANLGNPLTASPYSLSWDSTTATNGLHTLTAVVWDAAGNQSAASPVVLAITNVVTPPLSLPAVIVVATIPTAVLGTTNYGAFMFTRLGGTNTALVVNYSLGGTAIKGSDYLTTAGDMPVSITIPAGASSYIMNIVAVTNQTGANPETVTLTLSSDPSYTLGSSNSATITIVSNTVVALPTVTITATVPTATIGTTNYGVVTFARSGDTSAALTVNYSLGGTATKWDDYRRPVTGDMPVSMVIPAGASSYAMSIAAIGNEFGVSPETASFTLSADPGYTIGAPNSATITLLSNAVAVLPTVTAAAPSPSASRVGPTNGLFSVTRTGDTSAPLTVAYSLGGTAVNGTDYSSLATSVTIPAGANTTTLAVAPLPSATLVSAETIILTVSANSAYTLGSSAAATVTIAGNSVPCSISRAPGNSTRIAWSSVVGKTYRVAEKNRLSDTTWINLSGPITATSTTTSYIDTTSSKAQHYYVVYVTN